MPFNLKTNLEEWKLIRDETQSKMNEAASMLEDVREQQKTQLTCAKASLASNVIGCAGAILAPFSGGLSLVATSAAFGISSTTMAVGFISNRDMSATNKRTLKDAEEYMKKYQSESERLLEIHSTIVDIEEMELFDEVTNIVLKYHQSMTTTIDGNCPETKFGTNNQCHKFIRNVFGVAGALVSTTHNIKQTTQISKQIKQTSNIARNVKKTASVSKMGVTLSAVAIPFDVYNIVNIESDMETTLDNIKTIRGTARDLGKEILDNYTTRIELFYEKHIVVLQVYEETREEKLYELLEMCHVKLHLKLPTK